jgi:Predicted transcriptional regulators
MNRLRQLRKSAGLSQLEFAKIIDSAQNTVSNWERGIRNIDNDRLAEISAYFNVTADYLLGISNEEKPATETGSGLDKATIELATKLQQLDTDALRLLDAHADLLLKRQQEN